MCNVTQKEAVQKSTVVEHWGLWVSHFPCAGCFLDKNSHIDMEINEIPFRKAL